MTERKSVALIAHDSKKSELVEWARRHREALDQFDLYATRGTGELIESSLGLTLVKLQSGPLGGDLQIGARIVDGALDALIFFWDPLEAQPHDPDVKALLRVAVVWNIPFACNRASADSIVSSIAPLA